MGAAAPLAAPLPVPPPLPELPTFPNVDVGDIGVEFTVEQSAFPETWAQEDIAPAADVALRLRYTELRLQEGFDELLSLGAISNIEHFGYQLDTVRRVLRDFRGRVLLADEVGLGKTIEACLTLKEYWMRGLARKVLILTPASLVGQWVDELTERFALTPVAADAQLVRRDEDLWRREPLVVASLPLARQSAYRDRLSRIDYDLVIVDEAHALKNRASAGWQLVSDLKKRFLLLLSATPVGNSLTELYNLIQLLRPGLLFGGTNWTRILELYDQLLVFKDMAAVRLNQIVALRHAEGPLAALEQLDASTVTGSWPAATAFLRHTIRADILDALGRADEARQSWRAALAAAPTAADRAFVAQRAGAGPADVPTKGSRASS